MKLILKLVIFLVLTEPIRAAGPSIESVAPAVGQCGSKFTLKLVGARLSNSCEVLFYSPGVTCVDLNAANDNELSLTLQAAADCRLGTHPFRVRTSRGVSALRSFRITPFPVMMAVEPNDHDHDAMLVPSNVTITGTLEKGDFDFFLIHLRRGERLAAEVEAVRLGANLVDTVLTVFGPDGQRLAEVDDAPLFSQDPFLTLVAPADGTYLIRVHEANLEGDENSRYALHVGTFPRPSSIFPAGGPAGGYVELRFIGDALGPFERRIELPASPQVDYGIFAEHQGLTSPTPNPFRVSPFENVLEIEPNDEPATSRHASAELPMAFNGILQKPGDVDHYVFRMEAGVRFQFEAFADRIGSPADTVISILDNDGRVLVANDDDRSHDSRLVFQAPRTDEYWLRVTDQRGAGGSQFVYRVEASEPHPELIAFLPRPNRLSQEGQAIAVPRGNRVMTFLGVQRHGVDSEVRLAPQGLPAGISNFPATIAADRFLVPIIIEAASDAPLGGKLVQILATGAANGSTLTGEFQQVVDLINASADRLYQSVTVDRLAIAVVDAAPFRLQLDSPKAPLVQDGTIELTVRVDRDADFAEAIDVTFPFLPPWVDGPAKLTIPPNEYSAVFVAHAFPESEPRAWQVCAEGRAVAAMSRGSVSTDPEPVSPPPVRRSSRRREIHEGAIASQLVDLQIAKSPVTGTIGSVAGEQGTLLRVDCVIEKHGPIPEQLEATLEGLPNRVQAQPITMHADEARVTFSIQLDANAPIGEFNSLVCRLSGTVDGQRVSFHVGRGGVLKIVAKGELFTDSEGRPLSPLEAIRKR